MALVASVDYAARRIYLSAATADTDLDTLAVYREVRALRRTTPAHQRYRTIIVAGGNLPKITGVSYTPAYVQLLHGCRIVPYNGSHDLRLVRDTFTDDGLAGRDCFDRTPLSSSVEVNIDVDFPEIEIRAFATSGNEYSLKEISEQTSNAVLSSIIEQSFDLRGAMRLLLSFATGDASGLDGENPSFRDLANTKNRIVATMENGTRIVTARDSS